jgi:hypothetical protein
MDFLQGQTWQVFDTGNIALFIALRDLPGPPAVPPRWPPICTLVRGSRADIWFLEADTMITMTLTIHSIIAMPEKWAKACQISGQSRLWHAAIVLEALAEYRPWLMASWIFQMLITAAVLISLINRAH